MQLCGTYNNMDESKPDTSSGRMEEFIMLLSQCDQSLNSYVLSMVPALSDAQDILQETKVALWRSFDSFESGTNFSAWARKAAYYRILNFKRQKGRENQRLWFTDECYDLLAEDFEASADSREEESARLHQCIAKLEPNHREILILRYFKESSVEEVADRVGRSIDATYRVLSRIRLSLRECLKSQSPSSSS